MRYDWQATASNCFQRRLAFSFNDLWGFSSSILGVAHIRPLLNARVEDQLSVTEDTIAHLDTFGSQQRNSACFWRWVAVTSNHVLKSLIASCVSRWSSNARLRERASLVAGLRRWAGTLMPEVAATSFPLFLNWGIVSIQNTKVGKNRKVGKILTKVPTAGFASLCDLFQVCMNCLRAGHIAEKCRAPSMCKKCTRHHHTLLHRDADNSTQKKPENAEAKEEGACSRSKGYRTSLIDDL